MIAGLDSKRIQAGDLFWDNDSVLNAVVFPDSPIDTWRSPFQSVVVEHTAIFPQARASLIFPIHDSTCK
ncbi:hypothetical protein G3N96_00545 [Burkholderia sp. Se-20373]|uniref:hypothetical protein n=1 Tax=Burkholderia sp. Se-20373 TaxID=2703898 RepID=UPI00198148B4|nr:hypothetical protein [Burkholderia sp. Se-20373]MBN3743943.1 hypothetical protein [Burkholderia sp. Se-20373]